MGDELNRLLKGSEEAQEYFNSLPAYVQETLQQTSICLKTEEDLKNCANNIMG